jgi:hypothetical protein
LFARFLVFIKFLIEHRDNHQVNAYCSITEKELVTVTEKIVKMDTPIGVFEFVEDDEFREMIASLDAVRLLGAYREGPIASYDEAFWGGADCE